MLASSTASPARRIAVGRAARRRGAPVGAGAARPDHDVASAVAEALRLPALGPAARASSRRAAGARRSSWSRHRCPLPGVEGRSTADGARRHARRAHPRRHPTGASDGARRRRAGASEPARRELEALLPPVTCPRLPRHRRRARRRGRVACDHSRARRRTRWVSPALVETDLVVTVSAAETVLHGGPAALLGACGPSEPRAAARSRCSSRRGSDGWGLATSLESRLARHVPLIGVSLVLDHPRPTGRYRGWPWEEETVTRLARARLRRLHNASPARRSPLGAARARPARWTSSARWPGRPAWRMRRRCLRGTALKGARARRAARRARGAASVGDRAPAARAPRPDRRRARRARPRAAPVARAAPRSCRVARWCSCTALRPAFDRTSAAPYRALYEALREPDPERLAQAEIASRRATAPPSTPIAPDAHRTRCSRSPTGPPAQPALAHAGRVIVGGCRDAVAAKRLGFVPEPQPAGRARDGRRRRRRRRTAGRAAGAALPPARSSGETEPKSRRTLAATMQAAGSPRDDTRIRALRPRSGRLQGLAGGNPLADSRLAANSVQAQVRLLHALVGLQLARRALRA